MLIAAMLAGCGGTQKEKCQAPFDVCPNAADSEVVYLCDGGPCGAGASNVQLYFECICPSPSISVVFKQPGTDQECSEAHAAWRAECH